MQEFFGGQTRRESALAPENRKPGADAWAFSIDSVEDCHLEGSESIVGSSMANYLTRVELHRPYLDDAYTRLHDAMEKMGFKRVILGKNGEWYHLPHGEYTLVSDNEVSQIVTLAKGVANGIHSRNEVLAVQYERSGVMWQGLKRVE